jgi:hypothetical protein
LLKSFEKDYDIKKELNGITKLNPDVRYYKLKNFLEKLRNNPDAQKDMQSWKMDLSEDALKVQIFRIFQSKVHVFGLFKTKIYLYMLKSK